MELFITILGYIAGVVTVFMYVPQSIKVMKGKTAKGLSKITFVTLFFAFIIFVNLAPLLNLWQMWAPNMLIIIISLPILWYMFEKRKIIFVILLILGMSSITISLVQFLVPLSTNMIVATIMSTIAGLIIGIIFTPQTILVIKNKSNGNVSVISATFIAFGNFLWVVFYGVNFHEGGRQDFAQLIVGISCAFGILLQIPMIYFHFKNQNKVLIKNK